MRVNESLLHILKRCLDHSDKTMLYSSRKEQELRSANSTDFVGMFAPLPDLHNSFTESLKQQVCANKQHYQFILSEFPP